MAEEDSEKKTEESKDDEKGLLSGLTEAVKKTAEAVDLTSEKGEKSEKKSEEETEEKPKEKSEKETNGPLSSAISSLKKTSEKLTPDEKEKPQKKDSLEAKDSKEDEEDKKHKNAVEKEWDNFNKLIGKKFALNKDDAQAVADSVARIMELLFGAAKMATTAVTNPVTATKFAAKKADEGIDEMKQGLKDNVVDPLKSTLEVADKGIDKSKKVLSGAKNEITDKVDSSKQMAGMVLDKLKNFSKKASFIEPGAKDILDSTTKSVQNWVSAKPTPKGKTEESTLSSAVAKPLESAGVVVEKPAEFVKGVIPDLGGEKSEEKKEQKKEGQKEEKKEQKESFLSPQRAAGKVEDLASESLKASESVINEPAKFIKGIIPGSSEEKSEDKKESKEEKKEEGTLSSTAESTVKAAESIVDEPAKFIKGVIPGLEGEKSEGKKEKDKDEKESFLSPQRAAGKVEELASAPSKIAESITKAPMETAKSTLNLQALDLASPGKILDSTVGKLSDMTKGSMSLAKNPPDGTSSLDFLKSAASSVTSALDLAGVSHKATEDPKAGKDVISQLGGMANLKSVDEAKDKILSMVPGGKEITHQADDQKVKLATHRLKSMTDSMKQGPQAENKDNKEEKQNTVRNK